MYQYQSQLKVAAFLDNLIFCKEKKALAFNRDRCCHIPFCFMADSLPLACPRRGGGNYVMSFMDDPLANGDVSPGKSYGRGRLNTVDLLVLTSLDHLLFKLKILFTFLQNKLP
jgi:hypothetical protein